MATTNNLQGLKGVNKLQNDEVFNRLLKLSKADFKKSLTSLRKLKHYEQLRAEFEQRSVREIDIKYIKQMDLTSFALSNGVGYETIELVRQLKLECGYDRAN